jgi:flagellar assembly factor FliW
MIQPLPHPLMEEERNQVFPIFMPVGMIGFEGYQQFNLLPIVDLENQNGFYFLKSLEEPGLEFVVMEASSSGASESGMIARSDWDSKIRSLGGHPEHCAVLLVVTIDKNEDDSMSVAVNLRAPLIWECKTGKAWQFILENPNYPISFGIQGI